MPTYTYINWTCPACKENSRDEVNANFGPFLTCTCGKGAAPRFNEETANMINRQLAALDNRGWQVVKDEV